jgi:hypothetical protein
MACSVFDAMLEEELSEVHRKAGFSHQISVWLGTTVAPNPDVPLRFDWPKTAEAREKWNAYCLQNPETIAKHQATLNNLLEIILIVPEASGCVPTNHTLIQRFEAAGIPVTQIDWKGGHTDAHN